MNIILLKRVLCVLGFFFRNIIVNDKNSIENTGQESTQGANPLKGGANPIYFIAF